MEVNESAKVWRFADELSAHEQAIFLDGHWKNVIVHESFAMKERTWVVVAWHAG